MKKQPTDEKAEWAERIEKLAQQTYNVANFFQRQANRAGKPCYKENFALALDLSKELESIAKVLKMSLPLRDGYKAKKCFKDMKTATEALEKALPKCRLFSCFLTTDTKVAVQELRTAVDEYTSI